MKKTNYNPNAAGYYGPYGGQYAPELLIPALEELTACFLKAKSDKKFLKDLSLAYRDFVGRPTPLMLCENLTKHIGGAKIFIKNEGLAHTGAHKINHCVGQALLAKRLGKKRIIAETGAGQHGVATAAVCARFGFECVVYMGAIDIERQRPNVFWIEQLGATVKAVNFGGKRLKDAVNAAIKDWVTNVRDTHYLLGSCVGPYPFPEINRFFQKVVGEEIKSQLKNNYGLKPDYVIACVGGGSNAMGAFNAFLADKSVKLIGVEGGGFGNKTGEHAMRFKGGKVGVVEGYKSYWLQDSDGQISDTHSVSAGLDYAGVGPLHAYLKDTGRVEYDSARDKDVLAAVKLLAKTEGIVPALESAHALAKAIQLAAQLPKTKTIVVNISGRGDKDLFILAKQFGDKEFIKFTANFSKHE
ncbi:MAG: tryptophan synthase subunit beta [Deltaproteobacteria bacterium]|nr:tryptophan synthase subunit beta [Deltaproteobacteria bacterium]